MSLDAFDFIGASCLLVSGGRLLLEVQKQGKWLYRPGQPPLIGIGCIGGTIEPGESVTEALRREAREEMAAKLICFPAHKQL